MSSLMFGPFHEFRKVLEGYYQSLVLHKFQGWEIALSLSSLFKKGRL